MRPRNRSWALGATDATPDQWSDRYGSYLADAVTLYPPNDLPLVRAMRGERVDAVEVFIRNAKVPDGRLLSITGRPLKDENGTLWGGVVVFHDITLQKRAQEALVLAKEGAERASKFKDQFLSTMSHELSTSRMPSLWTFSCSRSTGWRFCCS
jgi:signal transduction histidine kinase